MSKPRFSLIIPVYNGAAFIQQTLESVVNQLIEGVEIIIVNDGSKDETITIIQQSFQQYLESRQLSIHTQQNQGVSAARNYGISLAQGEFIGFMDADDMLLPTYMRTIMQELNEQVDIVEFGFKTFVSNLDDLANKPTLYSNQQFGHQSISNIIDKTYSIARWYPWSRVFRASLFETVRFPASVRFCEDLMTIPQLYEKSQNVNVLSDALYGYRINPNSATFRVGQDYIEKLIGFYHGIPRSNLIRHDYLRLAVAYAIYSCQTKATGNWQMPPTIQQDLNRLRYRPSFYFNLEPRRVAILFYPFAFRTFRLLKSLLKSDQS